MPRRLARLLLEARWIAMAAAFVYFVMILLSYNKADPGWSHANTVANIANLGGKAGAWLADLLLFIFGFSTWWWGALFLRAVWRGWQRLTDACRWRTSRSTRTNSSCAGSALVSCLPAAWGWNTCACGPGTWNCPVRPAAYWASCWATRAR
jgi:DNA segregation ATPase FtsK/SpoIIIE-like protein